MQKGQSGLEYLIILASALAAAAIIIALLFGGSSTSGEMTRENAGNIFEQMNARFFGCKSGEILCGETCIDTCSNDLECDDSNPDTINTCENPGTCIATCVENSNCEPDNGTCPEGCAWPADNDCEEIIGECELPNLECTDGCRLPACTNSLQCDDSESSTTNTCENAGTCDAQCTYTPITECTNEDGYCPAGCTPANDDDCAEIMECIDDDSICPEGCWDANDNDCKSLREWAELGGKIKIGTMLAHPLQDPANPYYDEQYTETLTREYNLTPPGAAMQFLSMEPTKGNFDFSEADGIMGFAAENDMLVHANHLVWHFKDTLPNFLKDPQIETPGELEEILENHIKTSVTHFKNNYPGRIAMWNVVNEAVSGCPDYTVTYTPELSAAIDDYKLIGQEPCETDDASGEPVNVWIDMPDYIYKAFTWAHEADPTAKLYYNDYGIEGGAYPDLVQYWWNELRYQQVKLLVTELKSRGAPITGVGFQIHNTLDWMPTKSDLKNKFSEMNALGLKVSITELEIGINTNDGDGITPAELEQQAQAYKDVTEACLESPNCEAVISWCFTDKYTWLPIILPGYEKPCLLDEDYNPKPAYFAVRDALQEAAGG